MAEKKGKVIGSAADLINARPLKVTKAYVEYWKAEVHFRELTGAGIDVYLNIELTPDGQGAKVNREYLIGTLQQTLCDADGTLLFGGVKGREQLEGLAWSGLQELFRLSSEAIGNTKERVDEKKDG